MMRKLMSVLLTLCLLLGTLAMAETNQTVRVDDASFTIAPELMVISSDDNRVMAIGENYDLLIICRDWADEELAELEKYTSYGIQANNLYGMYLEMTKDASAALEAARTAELVEIGLLHGDKVAHMHSGSVYLSAHYYRQQGVMVMVMPVNITDSAEIMSICDEVLLSFRLDGVSEEDMLADDIPDAIVITAATAWIRREPSISAEQFRKGLKGEVYELIEQQGDWYVIRVDDKIGYVHSGVTAVQE